MYYLYIYKNSLYMYNNQMSNLMSTTFFIFNDNNFKKENTRTC